MSSLTTNFNVPPYFDDYEEAKKYYRLLFRPRVAVQARELTQLQTIQQKQVERFANHIFKDGSVVEGCSPTILPNLNFVRVNNNFNISNTYSVTDLNENYLLVGVSSNVRASAVISKSGSLQIYPDTNRIYYSLILSGINDKKVFDSGETIKVYNANQDKQGELNEDNLIDAIDVLTTNSSVSHSGTGYGFKIENGIIYQKGFFQIVDDTTILVREYDQEVANHVIGFETTEEIVTENVDVSLNDNALGYSNENAPGSHRLKLVPSPVVKLRTDIVENESFFAIYEFSNISNALVLNKTKSSYDELGEVLSKRTFEESGDYVVKPFIIDTAKNTDTPEKTDKFDYIVSSGIGYVRGSRVEYETSNKIEANRATTTLESREENVTANYGNYVIVDELRGALAISNLVTIEIHNQPFNTISNGFIPAGGSTKIGTAKVKTILHNEGDPGLATTTYRLYLTDIVMDSSYSFSENAKSFYVATADNGNLGNFYADILLTPAPANKAVVQGGNRPNLVFPLAKSGLKTLRSSGGTINDTQFNYRVNSIATLQTDGGISVTIPTPVTGGNEEIGYSPVADLGDVLENQILVSVSANVSTANISVGGVSATLSVNTGSNVAIVNSAPGVGFNLLNYFSPGEMVRIYASGGLSSEYKTIANVSSNSLRFTNNYISTPNNSAATFAKHFPAGYNFPLDDNTYSGDRKVAITSETTMEIDVGISPLMELLSETDVNVQYKVTRTQATQAKKEVRKNRYVKLLANSSANNTWNLGIPDVYNLRAVYASTSGYTNAAANEVTSYFTLNNGQRADYYDHAKLVLKPQHRTKFKNNDYLTVAVDHFVPNYNNGVGFFSIDSYPIDDINKEANVNAIQTASIPIFSYEDSTIDLRNAIDFRLYKANTANSSTTLAGASVNPVTTNNFVAASATHIIEPDSNFQADIEYYLPRKDLITLSIGGALNVLEGTPSENPKVPQNTSDTMVLAIADVPPYPTLTYDEAVSFNRIDDAIKTEIFTNRVYTMRDIGVLDERIQNLEYYTSLIALELAAKDLAVLDSAGNNRFKNGIFVDPMNSYDFQATNDIEYDFTLDLNSSYGRSTFNQKTIDLEYNAGTSTNVQKTGNYLTKPYTEELYIFQPFATKFRNNAQDFWAWNGSVALYPPNDINKTVSQGPAADTTFRLFINSRNVAFVAKGLKPNTKIYPYFDDIKITQHCAPAEVNTTLGATLEAALAEAARRGRPEDALRRSGNFGTTTTTTLTTDSNGNLLGIFRIPADTFKVGDRGFRLLDIDSLTLGNDAIITSASATFTAYNYNVAIPPPPPPPVIINITNNTFNTTINNRFEGGGARGGGNTGARRDPLAQSFFINAPQGQSGVFLTKMDLFFKKKDPTLGLEIVVVGMDNGVPNSRDIKGTAKLTSSQVLISDNASIKTVITFDFPIFLTANEEYAFFIIPEGNSPEYQMWVCEIGDFDVITNSQVFQNPYGGEMYRSSNAGTWTAIPNEDMKFNLYVANFSTNESTVYFQNETDDFVSANVFALEIGKSIQIGQEIYPITATNNITIPPQYADKEGYVQFVDENNNLVLNNSKGIFTNNMVVGIFQPSQQSNAAQCNSASLIARAVITTVNNPVMHSMIPKIFSVVPAGTSINYGFKGTSNTGVIETSYNDFIPNELREFTDRERVVYSYSNEVAASKSKTLTIKATMKNSNKYVSPIIDLTNKSVIAIENNINNDIDNEDTRYGDAVTKYISKPVVLADGQDAEDFLLYLTGYRPINTDIHVYVKFLSSLDPGSLEAKAWSKLENTSPSLRSSSGNTLDFKEFVYRIPASAPTSTSAYKPTNSSIMKYADETGAIYETFKSFIVKIVLTSDNKIYVPKVKDIRSIALQV